MRGLLRVILAVLIVVALAMTIERLLENRDRREHPLRGALVDAGGFRLRLLASGAGMPGPTVLLETGIGGATASTWGWEQRGVEAFAPVLSYDRAGLGDSEPGPMPRDGRRLVEELHRALAGAGLKPPYVFVGHSYGGLLARLFVDRYPAEIAGLVLCEPSHPGQFGGLSPRRPPRLITVLRAIAGAAPGAARLGLIRAFLALVPTDADRLPALERAEQKMYLARADHWVGTVRELEAWAPLTNPEARDAGGFGARPTIVITAGGSAAQWGPWVRMQDEVARLSSDAIHRVEPGATHGSLVADSTHARVVVAAIREVVQAVREHRTLHEIDAASPR